MDYLPPMESDAEGERGRASAGARSGLPSVHETLQRDLEAGLGEALGGFEALDTGLALDFAAPEGGPEVAADLVGLDGAGRLVLVQLVGPGDRESALGRALDLAAEADSRRALLERHFGRALGADPALVVLVGSELDPALVRRAAAVGTGRLRVLGARALRTAGGASTWFTPLDGASSGTGVEPLAGVGSAGREAASAVRARLARLGAEVLVTPAGGGLAWRWRGATVCALAARGEALEGRVEVDGALERRPLTDGAALERFLDAALARYLVLLDAGAPEPARPAPLPVAAGASSASVLSQAERDAFLTGP